MRYMGSVAPLSQQEAAFVAGFQQAYPALGPSAQEAVYLTTVQSGGGADANLKHRVIAGAGGLVLGLIVGVLAGRR